MAHDQMPKLLYKEEVCSFSCLHLCYPDYSVEVCSLAYLLTDDHFYQKNLCTVRRASHLSYVWLFNVLSAWISFKFDVFFFPKLKKKKLNKVVGLKMWT